MALSLVHKESIERDPRKLAYLHPRLPLKRYKELTDDYYQNKALKAAEDAAKLVGMLLVPSSCLHSRRRDANRRLHIFNRTYYMIQHDDLTEMELYKFKAYCAAGQL